MAYCTDVKESYDVMSRILVKIDYNAHRWKIVSDFKVLAFLNGMQGGYTKYPCFLCEWDSRAHAEHYVRKDWPVRQEFKVGQKNVLNVPLVDPADIILPPLHIKLGLIKQFVKALDKNGSTFEFLRNCFPRLSQAKIKEGKNILNKHLNKISKFIIFFYFLKGIFIGPQIRKLMKNTTFSEQMTAEEKRAWTSFIAVCENFLGNKRSPDYVDVVKELLEAYHAMGCNMSTKLHYLHSHLDFFPQNLGRFSDEQGERFHQEILKIEQRYVGKCTVHMLSDYCWSLKRNTADESYKRRRTQKHF